MHWNKASKLRNKRIGRVDRCDPTTPKDNSLPFYKYPLCCNLIQIFGRIHFSIMFCYCLFKHFFIPWKTIILLPITAKSYITNAQSTSKMNLTKAIFSTTIFVTAKNINLSELRTAKHTHFYQNPLTSVQKAFFPFSNKAIIFHRHLTKTPFMVCLKLSTKQLLVLVYINIVE